MDFINFFLNLLLHLDEFLQQFISQYGVLIYLLLFVILFCETGLFVLFLPGDSLIFACAAFSAIGLLNIWIVVVICFTSAFLGDSLNYYFGQSIGKKIYKTSKGRFIKRENIDKANEFYKKHGGKAIVLSRFIPLVRQFTPFVAGIGKMSYEKFMEFNLIGVILWVGIMSIAGYFFGNIPVVKNNFTTVILSIIFVSLIPAIVTFFKTNVLNNEK
ncbi:MAG: VTT domain-containing protein [Clostridiales bacterium]|nr:VTT domain-containing protein [Clostridiales bacterium]